MKKKLVSYIMFFLLVFAVYAQTQAKSAGGFVPLVEAARQLDAQLAWDALSEGGTLQKNGHVVQFTSEEQLVCFDNTQFEMLDAPKNVQGTIFVSPAFLERVERFFERENSEAFFKIGAILIDPGHGGKDSGAVGTHTIKGKKTNVAEKDVVLQISEQVYRSLKTAYPDKKIIMTRSDDTFLTLEERVEIANTLPLAEHEAILFVSIHANSAFDKKAKGFEVWYLSPGYRRTILSENAADKEILPILNSMLEEEFTTESILIAKFISDGLEAEIGKQSPNRGLKEEEWFVVRNANMPSVLVEVGFVSNQQEAELLTDESYLRKVSAGIYNGLTSFIAHFERSRGFTSGQ